MSDEDQDLKAIEAAKLYTEGSFTFQDVADKLEVSKSHAQVLVKKGIELVFTELGKRNPSDVIPDIPSSPNTIEGLFPSRSAAFPGQFPQDPRSGSYMLETSGIGRRVLLTPKDILIFDLWKGAGFQGDLSDFISDSINFMYESRRPRERLNY